MQGKIKHNTSAFQAPMCIAESTYRLIKTRKSKLSYYPSSEQIQSKLLSQQHDKNAYGQMDEWMDRQTAFQLYTVDYERMKNFYKYYIRSDRKTYTAQ